MIKTPSAVFLASGTNRTPNRTKTSVLALIALSLGLSACAEKEGVQAQIDGQGVSGYQQSLSLLKKQALPSQIKAWEGIEKHYGQEQIMTQCDNKSFANCANTLISESIDALEKERLTAKPIYDKEVLLADKMKLKIVQEFNSGSLFVKSNFGDTLLAAEIINNTQDITLASDSPMTVMFNEKSDKDPQFITLPAQRVELNKSNMNKSKKVNEPLKPGQKAFYLVDASKFSLKDERITPTKLDASMGLITAVIQHREYQFDMFPDYYLSKDSEGKRLAYPMQYEGDPDETFPPRIKALQALKDAFISTAAPKV